MRGRSRAGSDMVKARRRKAATVKRHNAPKSARRRVSSDARHETKVVRLTRELKDLLEQQTATSEVLRVISSSPGALEAVFDSMLANATRICEAEFGFLWLTEGAGFRPVALHGVPRALADEFPREQILRFDPETPLGRLAETKQLVHVADIRTEPRYIAGFRPLVALAEIGEARTLLLVPMLKDNAQPRPVWVRDGRNGSLCYCSGLSARLAFGKVVADKGEVRANLQARARASRYC